MIMMTSGILGRPAPIYLREHAHCGDILALDMTLIILHQWRLRAQEMNSRVIDA